VTLSVAATHHGACNRQLLPDRYEYIFAYNNLIGPVTIGLKDQDGRYGVQYAYESITVTNGMAVCFDFLPDSDGD
jgi:hypothetical protein